MRLREEIGSFVIALLILAEQAKVGERHGIGVAGSERQGPLALSVRPIAAIRVDDAEIGVNDLRVGLQLERPAIKHLISAPIAITLDGDHRVGATNDNQADCHSLAQEEPARGSRLGLSSSPESCGGPAHQPAKADRREIEIAFGKDLRGHPAGIQHRREGRADPEQRERHGPRMAPQPNE